MAIEAVRRALVESAPTTCALCHRAIDPTSVRLVNEQLHLPGGDDCG